MYVNLLTLRRVKMKKFCLTLVLILILASSFYAQTPEEEEKDPSKPTPEKETRTGVISITGFMGPINLADDSYSTKSPSLKLGFHWNFNQYVSVSLGGGIIKYDGPDTFVIEEEGYYLSPEFLALLEPGYYFGPSKFEESWYSAQLTFRLIDGTFSPYIFGGFKYLSIDYEQEMFFRYKGMPELLNEVWQVTLNDICLYTGGGIAVSVKSYMDILLEFEYDTILDSDIVPDKILFSAGFRFTI
jgi:opacity protein-like surface antigen